jgi:hypothetical protein
VPTRREEQYALLDEHRRLTAQLWALTERFHTPDFELVDASLDRRTRLLAILQDELEVLRRARALDADIRRLFLDGTLPRPAAKPPAGPPMRSPDRH